MSDARAQALFFPYPYADEAIAVALSSCLLDGAAVVPVWNEERLECDLSGETGWATAELIFALERKPKVMWVDSLVPPNEKAAPPIRLVGTVHCGTTFYRADCEGSIDADAGRGELRVTLKRQDLAQSVDLDVFVVRAGRQAMAPEYASDAAARIIASRRVTVRIDAAARRQGPGLRTEWESFAKSTHPYRAQHPQVLFHLDTSKSEPVLFLNQDADPDLRAILAEEAPRGKKAALRNVLFAAVAIPVWMSLVRQALAAVDQDGDMAEGWQRNVLSEVATVAEPGCDRSEALRRLVDDLRDPAGGHAIEERLPVIISELVAFRKKAEESAGVLL